MADAFKAMALSYGAGALGRGIMGGLSTTGGTFAGGLTKGLTEPFSAASNLFSSGAANPLAQGILGPRVAGLAFSGLSGTDFAKQPFGGGTGIMDKIFPEYQTPSATPALAGAGLGSQQSGIQPVSSQANLADQARAATAISGTDQGVTQWRLPDGRVMSNEARELVLSPAFRSQGIGSIKGSDNLLESMNFGDTIERGGKIFEKVPVVDKTGGRVVGKLVEKAADKPGMINQLGQFVTGGKLTGTPATLAGAGVAGLGLYAGAKMLGLTEDEASVADQLSQLDAANPQRAAYDRWSAIADKNSDEARRLKAVWYRQPQYTAEQLRYSYGANPLQGITPGTPGSPLTAAGGGEVMGPGTGTSDSIPAMLSDGEFVMTAKAVRNAGNGDRDVGAARMYDMMNRFERGMA